MDYADLKARMDQDARLQDRLKQELHRLLYLLCGQLTFQGALEGDDSFFGTLGTPEVLDLDQISVSGSTAEATVPVRLESMPAPIDVSFVYRMVPTENLFARPRRSLRVKRPLSAIGPMPTEMYLDEVPTKAAHLLFKHLGADYPLGDKSYSGN